MFHENRQHFLELLQYEGAAALIPTGAARIRNHDSDYRFRPGSDFYYLTGFREPDAVLLLLGARETERAVLFLNEKNREAETWTGRRLGVEAAPDELGVERAFPLRELWTRLPELLEGHARLVYRSGEDAERDRRVNGVLADMRARTRSGNPAPREVVDPSLSLHELRLKKSPAEIERMSRAAAISGEAHRAAMRAAKPGMNECEIDALLDYTFRRRGGTGSAYPNIVAGGENACVLHYRENDRPLADGELLLIDAGCEWDFYASDVTRTFPVNGRFTREQRALYEVVLRSQKAALALVEPGKTQNDVHEAALHQLVEGLIELGLLTGTREERIQDESYRRFYMHRTGHWLGLDVHDCGAYFLAKEPRAFEPGMVTTVEPGLYVAPDDDTVEKRWRGIGIRIEDDVLVTATGGQILTTSAPKEVDEIEAACRGARLEPVP